jgi:hypothetical protein
MERLFLGVRRRGDPSGVLCGAFPEAWGSKFFGRIRTLSPPAGAKFLTALCRAALPPWSR